MTTPVQRLMTAVRANVLRSPRAAPVRRSLLDDADLFRAHAEAARSSKDAAASAQAAGATAQQQRSALDAVSDRLTNLAQLGRDVKGTSRVARDALDKIRLVAMNAALEGARLGEAQGRALVTIADEIKSHLSRAVDASEDEATLVEQAESERDRLRVEVDEARSAAGRLAEDLMRSASAQGDAHRKIVEMESDLSRVAGTDPETAAAAARAAEHAKGLLEALSALSVRTHGSIVLRTLRPSIEPILRTIRDLDRRGGSGRG